MQLMASKIRAIAHSISDTDVEAFLAEILNAQRIYVMGAGRSGLVAKGFAMRLMHLGLQSYVVGETITPALRKGDVIVIFSGSGRTKTVADIAETGKGDRGAHLPDHLQRRLADREDCRLQSDHRDTSAMMSDDDAAEFEIRQMLGDHKSFAPLGTLFETASMIFCRCRDLPADGDHQDR